MMSHDRSLELAAAAIDFGLSDAERRELDGHLAACPTCRRSAALLRADATAIGAAPRPVLSAQRSEVILRRSLRRRPPTSQLRLLAVAAALAVIGGGALAVGTQLFRDDDTDGVAVVPSPTASAAPSASPDPSPVGEPTPVPSFTPTPEPTVPPSAPPAGSGALPVRADARAIGTEIAMAPAGGGSLYVAVPDGRATVLTLLGPDGAPRAGWPVRVDAEFCRQVIAAPGGGVVAICEEQDPDAIWRARYRILRLDGAGRPVDGWPVAVRCCGRAVFVGDSLVLATSGTFSDVVEPDPETVAGSAQVVVVAPDGTVTEGEGVPTTGLHLQTHVGPDGTGYALSLANPDATATEIVAFDASGALPGWPIRFEGLISAPVFAGDRIVLNVGNQEAGTTRVVVLDRAGQRAAESGDLPILASAEFDGAGPDVLGRPVVGPDGTAWVVGDDASTGDQVIYAVSPDGAALAGWPWQPTGELAHAGFCGGGDTGCGTTRVPLSAGPGNDLRLAHGPTGTGDARGGAVTSLTTDGQVGEGWPVTLNREGSEFWGLVTDDDGITYALAIEPETGSAFSATVLALEPDSTVRYGVTIVEP